VHLSSTVLGSAQRSGAAGFNQAVPDGATRTFELTGNHNL
jgi:hypothetical protein